MRKERIISQIWFGKYRIISVLGRGGSATVYLVEHLKLQTFRAIKCIEKKHYLHEQLINEAYILKDLRHENIPIIYDIEEDETYSYIIEEYIKGISLRAFRLSNIHIQEDTIIDFSIQLCKLIEYLHSNEKKILYLDLKPENILIDKGILKLIDFGTATYNEVLESRKFAMGTRGYASPEQYNSNKLGEGCDIYGIGMLLFFLVTKITFNGKTDLIENIDKTKNCSKKLKNIINKCLKFNPSQRFSTVVQLEKKLVDINKKYQKQVHVESQKTLTISLAGAQNRIGTTHIALLFTSYINKYITMCLYLEQNKSEAAKSIIKRFQNVSTKSKITKIHYCHIGPILKVKSTDNLQSYNVVIKDFGVISEENLEQFLDVDKPILVLGAKEWELDYSENILKRLVDHKEINYLFNFVDGKSYQRVLKNMGDLKCLRMPFEPNPFCIAKNNGLSMLIEELLKDSFLLGKKTIRSNVFNSQQIRKVLRYKWRKDDF